MSPVPIGGRADKNPKNFLKWAKEIELWELEL